jgi:hypothetical protein
MDGVSSLTKFRAIQEDVHQTGKTASSATTIDRTERKRRIHSSHDDSKKKKKKKKKKIETLERGSPAAQTLMENEMPPFILILLSNSIVSLKS